MKLMILPALAAILTTGAHAETIDYSQQPLGPLELDAYGPGVAQDATGRAFRFKLGALGAAPRTRHHRPDYIDWSEQPMGEIRQDAYGPGTHSDATGRPFHVEPFTTDDD